MPIRRRALDAGVFLPKELALLGRVFEATAVKGETEAQREARAHRVIANFMAGITDEEELVELSRHPLRR